MKMHVDDVFRQFRNTVVTNEPAYNHMCTFYQSAIDADVLDTMKSMLKARTPDEVAAWRDYYTRRDTNFYGMDAEDVASAVIDAAVDVLDTYETRDMPNSMPVHLLSKILRGDTSNFTHRIATQFEMDMIATSSASQSSHATHTKHGF